jgi:hypothetical protein
MKLEKLFESLDEKVFTDELKNSLQETFDAAVIEASKVTEDEINEKVETLAEVKAVEMIAEKVEDKISELEEKAEEFQAILEEEAKEKESTLLDQVDLYLEKVVEDFIVEAQDALDESLKAEKADMIIEAMDAMIVATGTDILKISEAKDDTDAELKLAESIEKYDELMEENLALEKEKANMMKMGIIAELKEGLNVVEADKFEKLADLVEFSYDTSYLNKLETLKESLGNTKIVEKVEEKEEKQRPLVEKVEDEKVSLATAFSHLV